MNDNHVFKWVYEAFTHEIEQLKFQLGVLDEDGKEPREDGKRSDGKEQKREGL